jgi:hypothetical protein
MNKRINQLFEQALDQAVPETWTTLTPAQLLMVKDKFAELIVRECANVAAEHEALDIYEEIREHFGVEE